MQCTKQHTLRTRSSVSLRNVVSSPKTVSPSSVLVGEEAAAGISGHKSSLQAQSQTVALGSELTSLMTSLAEDPPEAPQEACVKQHVDWDKDSLR